MNRNVAIITVILVIVVIAGYLVWLRSRYQQPVVAPSVVQNAPVSPSPVETAGPSATPSAGPKEATGSVRQRTSTNSPAFR